jgi:hypothetical protein
MYLNQGKHLNSKLFYFIDFVINISFVALPFAITTQSRGAAKDSSVPPLIGGMIGDRMHPIHPSNRRSNTFDLSG